MERSAIDYIFDDVEEDITLTETYKALCSEGVALYNKLKKMLSKKQAKIFSTFVDKQLEIEAKSSEEYFKEGVKIGVRLTVECLCDK